MAFKSRGALALALVAALVATMSPISPARAASPGQNGKIAYIRNDSVTNIPTGKDCLGDNIWVMNADGSNQTNINNTQAPFAMGNPAWSPDGTKIAYSYVSQADVDDSGNPDTLIVGLYNHATSSHMAPAGAVTLLDHPAVDAAAFCENPYGPSWSPDGTKVVIQNYYGTSIINVSTHAVTHLDPPGTYTHQDISWAPFGSRFALTEGFKIQTMPSGGGALLPVTWSDVNGHPPHEFDDRDLTDLSEPDWSPNGRKVVFKTDQYGSTDDDRIGIIDVCAGGTLQAVDPNPRGAVHDGYQPAWSPDGNKIVFSDASYVPDAEQVGGVREEQDIWVMNPDGTGIDNLTETTKVGGIEPFESAPDWQPTNPTLAPDPPFCFGGPSGLEVTLDAFSPNGDPLDGTITIAQTVTVELTIKNTTQDTLDNFEFTGDQPLVIDSRSVGGLELASGPEPEVEEDLSLEPDEEIVYVFELTTTENGLAAAHSKVTAQDENNDPVEDAFSLRFDIADGLEVTNALGRFITLSAMDQFLQKTFGDWHKGMVKRGNRLYGRLSSIFDPKERKRWFGSGNSLPLTPLDFAMAGLRGVAPEMYAASTPKVTFKGFTVERLNRAYNDSFKEELGKGVSDYVNNWAHLGGTVKKGLQDSWSEAMLSSYYFFGTATPEERMQFEAYMYNAATGTDTSVDNLVNTVKREVPNWRANLTYFDEALDMAIADATLQSPDLQNQMAQEARWRENVLKLADTDPVAFQKAWAKRDAEIANLGLPLIFDTLAGGGVTRFGGAVKKVVVRGKGASIMRAGEAAGVLDETGEVVNGSKTAVDVADSSVPRGVTNAEAAEIERAGNYLDDIEGATIVQSSDLGDVYHLPNIGGVPEVTLEAKAGILGELEDSFAARFPGSDIELAEVLKPSSPYRKPGGVAKLELTPDKTGKPAMLDAGAPSDVLAEASVWDNLAHPSELPGFDDLSKPRQKAAIKEWHNANARWREWNNPAPGSKTERLQQCIGQRNTVPLDLEPNKAGLQRFVTAEFEVVEVTEGHARAKLIRVKHYEIEVRDMNRGGQVVNTKTVVDDLAEAAPQTPDADGLALAKVVGRDANNKPILAPLSRAEREFLMPRYIDKNIKARKKPPGTKGAIPDNAEHSLTWIMDDAPAEAAGKLIPRYGFPFMPANPGLTVLKRIAPHVTGKGATPAQIEAMYKNMLDIVHSEGGFGQHAVVVTRDTRYLGEVLLENW